MTSPLPRLVIAGLAGDSGKTLVSIGLARSFRRRGLIASVFKKGPDFIDAAWLGYAAGSSGRNLDTYMMPREAILRSLHESSSSAGIALIEGNRGLFDGLDHEGSHSTAALSRLTTSPVVLVIDVTKSTRTIAALVLGCMNMEDDVWLAGVILNRVGTARQEAVIRKAIEAECGLPVLGAIHRVGDQHLPSRHLGLVTAMEHPDNENSIELVADIVERHVDVAAVLETARRANPLPAFEPTPAVITETRRSHVKIGILKDRAFSFYYPENLSALQRAGARLVPISPLTDEDLPHVDALYAGGGFPEVYAAELSTNRSLLQKLAESIGKGMPVWAECGGLMYLSRAIIKQGATYPMVGALPFGVEQTNRPMGHGYTEAVVDTCNPLLPKGTTVRGHEFHYSHIAAGERSELATIFKLNRGTGIGGGRDGVTVGNVVATYSHLHATGAPDWAPGLVAAAAGKQDFKRAGGMQ